MSDYTRMALDRLEADKDGLGPEIWLERVTKKQQHQALLLVRQARDRLSKRTKAWKLLDQVTRILGDTVINRMSRDLMKKLYAPDKVENLGMPTPLFGLITKQETKPGE